MMIYMAFSPSYSIVFFFFVIIIIKNHRLIASRFLPSCNHDIPTAIISLSPPCGYKNSPCFLLQTQKLSPLNLSNNLKMCIGSTELTPFHLFYFARLPRQPKRRSNIQIQWLKRRKKRRMMVSSSEAEERERAELKTRMVFKNLELYLQNQSIMKENDKLREKALLLNKENKVLLSQLQKFSGSYLQNSNKDDTK